MSVPATVVYQVEQRLDHQFGAQFRWRKKTKSAHHRWSEWTTMEENCNAIVRDAHRYSIYEVEYVGDGWPDKE